MESTVRLSTTNNAKIMDKGVVSTDLIDFIIPAGETYNLSKSYVAMNMRINAPSDGKISDFILTSKKPAATANYNRVSPSLVHMVKNINVFAERTGKIEDIRAAFLVVNLSNLSFILSILCFLGIFYLFTLYKQKKWTTLTSNSIQHS
jgi:hypothetical protein